MNREHVLTTLRTMDRNLLIKLFQEVNQYENSFPFANIMDLKEICAQGNAYEIARAIIYGEVTNVTDPLCYDNRGNLYSTDEYRVYEKCVDNLDEMIDWLEYGHERINLSRYDLESCFE